MPYVLLIFGGILFISGVRGTNAQLWTLVKGDFTGSNSFLVWIAAIAVVGGVGYIPKLKPLSIAFMSLLLLVLFLSNKGVIAQLQSFVQNPQTTPPDAGASNTTGLQPLAPLAPISPTGSGPSVSLPIPQGLF